MTKEDIINLIDRTHANMDNDDFDFDTTRNEVTAIIRSKFPKDAFQRLGMHLLSDGISFVASGRPSGSPNLFYLIECKTGRAHRVSMEADSMGVSPREECAAILFMMENGHCPASVTPFTLGE